MGEEYARSPCERFPATGAFSVAPPERLSPPPPAPLPDRFSASPRRVRRCAEAERARRPRYVPPAAHVPVERYVPRPPAPLRPPPPVYCGLACRPPPPAPRKCCGPACREDIAGSPPPSRYVEYVGAAAARRLACTPPPPPPPALQLPCEPQEPPCCVQARRRPQPPHDCYELWAKYYFPNETWSSPKFQDELHSKHMMLCSKHFESTCFDEKKLFRTAAVPGVQSYKDTTISNLPDQPAIFEPVAGPSFLNLLQECDG